MQYTIQQLQGGPKYSAKTRIGNWSEDMELQGIQKQNYDGKKMTSSLPFATVLSKYQQSYRQVPWSYCPDGDLRWNMSVMIQNAHTEGFLVCDIGDKVPNVEEAYQITSTSQGQNPGPMTRSVFKITKVDDYDMFGSDEFIRFGQKVRLVANDYLHRKKLALASYKHTPAILAPVSQKQLACMSAAKQDASTIWVIDHVDPKIRYEKQGEVIKAGEPILIRHISTCVYLGTDLNVKYKNDFGSENEVHCFNYSTNNKSQNLALEFDGRLTSDVPTKFQQDKNVFFLQTASNASYDRPIEELQKFNMNDFLKELQGKIAERTQNGLSDLEKIFKAIDQAGDGNLDVDDFRWGLMDFGIQVSKEEAGEVLQVFDRDQNGSVNFNEFLKTLQEIEKTIN